MEATLSDPQVAGQFQVYVEKRLEEFEYSSGEDAKPFAEFIVVMLSNGKTQNQVNEELLDLLPSFDPQFTELVFDEAERLERVAVAEQGGKQQGYDVAMPEAAAGPPRSITSNSLRDAGPLSEGRYSPYNRKRGDGKRRGGILNGINGQMRRPMDSHIKQGSGGLPQPTPAQLMWMYEQMQKPGFDPTQPLQPPSSNASSIPLAERIGTQFKAADAMQSQQQQQPPPSAPTFTELCKFDSFCARPDCKFAHSTPAAAANQGVVLEHGLCAAGLDCTDASCVKSHPSPASRAQAEPPAETTPTQDAESNTTTNANETCSAFPRCTAKNCPYKHPQPLTVPCRWGASCTRQGCRYLHPHQGIKCRFNPCLNADCAFQHDQGQRQTFNKSWVAPDLQQLQEQPQGSVNGNDDAVDEMAALKPIPETDV